jgi:cytochrome c oxidase subunit 2
VSETSDPHGANGGVAERAEHRWATISVCIVVLFIGLMMVAGLIHGVMPQANVQIVDPSRLHLAGEFIEPNLGTEVRPDGGVVVRVIGQQYSFTPPCIAVPVDAPVTIRATSADVVHGFLIERTNINTMLVPGYVSELHTIFSRPGTYAMPCHEFCSVGHEGMWAQVQVMLQADFQKLAADRRRVSCAG